MALVLSVRLLAGDHDPNRIARTRRLLFG